MIVELILMLILLLIIMLMIIGVKIAGETIGVFVFGFICLILYIFVAPPGYDYYAFNHLRAEHAQNICEQKGYDVYAWYTRHFMDPKAYGVRCEYVDVSQKRINVESQISNNNTIVIT